MSSLPIGIYRDGRGFRVRVGMGGRGEEIVRWKRFPAGTPLAEMRAWQQRQRDELRRARPRTASGTLRADADTYLQVIQHLVSYRTVRGHLKAWCAALPGVRRHAITTLDVRTVRQVWLEEGWTPKTINNRVGTLQRLYRVLDGRRAVTPVDDLEPLHVPPAVPRTVPLETIRAVGAALTHPKTRARYLVLATTGVRASELMRAEPTDLDLERAIWHIRTGKGGWRPPLYLTEDARAAWESFVAADAWGWFHTGHFGEALRAAGWPPGIRAYELRHAFGRALSEAGIDLADVQVLMGHKRPETTRRYYVPALDSRLRKAMGALEGRLSLAAPRRSAS